MQEYIIDKYGDKVIIELKWGQGAKVIAGELQIVDVLGHHELQFAVLVMVVTQFLVDGARLWSALITSDHLQLEREGARCIDQTRAWFVTM